MSNGVPLPVLVARLEHELETLRFVLSALTALNGGLMPASMEKSIDLAAQIREAL